MPQDPSPGPNSDYFAARAVEERRMAMSSNDPKARAVHLELAEKYEALAGGDVALPEQQQIVRDQQRA